MAKADPQRLYAEPDPAAGPAAGQDDPLGPAFGQLEAALSRLEQAATLRPPIDNEMLKLKVQNAALRDTVGDALGQIDALLADMNGHD
ncbi:hypothetical protein [Croceicoccus marinus]|uniref:Uncharacterized protein n=1 Tax=Croceicoccus marinus TaxID=450378 RepID=A0A1Z1FA61_9SPHN|nr:hypothetical protein [Croceicoccus marinus]ARU15670.1 hypothetical protein A9D14_05105 [Croceicoccus marinus]